MIEWTKPFEWLDDAVDLEIIEESALARAQSTIQNAINRSGITRAEMARRMKSDRSLVTRILSGSHNLTVKTMAKSLAVCGFEVHFQPTALEWRWKQEILSPRIDAEPANAGSSMFGLQTSIAELALAV